MNDVREIVTRAVLAKGRKLIKLDETVFVSSLSITERNRTIRFTMHRL